VPSRRHYAELRADHGRDAECAARAIDRALAEVVAAYQQRQQIDGWVADPWRLVVDPERI
jgi:hypothetical protein